MIIVFCKAATAAAAFPSCCRPMIALNSVSRTSRMPVPYCLSGYKLPMPAASSTSCIGSRYWRANACQRGSALPSASLLGPNCWARAAASAELRPCCASTPSERRTWSALSVCHASSPAAGGRPDVGVSVTPEVMWYPLRLAGWVVWQEREVAIGAGIRDRLGQRRGAPTHRQIVSPGFRAPVSTEWSCLAVWRQPGSGLSVAGRLVLGQLSQEAGYPAGAEVVVARPLGLDGDPGHLLVQHPGNFLVDQRGRPAGRAKRRHRRGPADPDFRCRAGAPP